MAEVTEDKVRERIAKLDATVKLGESWDDTRTLRSSPEEPTREELDLRALELLPALSAGRATEKTKPEGRTLDLELEGILGEGGMGRVLLALQSSLAREVAVKTTHEGSGRSARAGLVSEALITGSLEHPNIVPVHMLGRDAEGQPLLVMKRVYGTTWRALIDDPRHGFWAKSTYALGERTSAHVDVLMQVCNALEYAHSRGVVHRDIKPDNVLVGAFGEVYLMDWGIALRADRGASEEALVMMGTPTFMAPEMVNPEVGAIGQRTDVYLLGATLHYLLTGSSPHRADTLEQSILRAWRAEPPTHPPGTPPELSGICRRAMRADPLERFASAREMRDALAEHLRHRGSAELSREAEGRLREARSAEGEPGRQTLLTEARFGFTQALREWRDNPEAREGLSRCLGAMIEREIEGENAAGAEGLLDALGDQWLSRGLREKLKALEVRIAERREAEARGRRFEADRDLSVGSRARSLVVAAMGAILVCTTAGLYLRSGPRGLNLDDLVTFQSVGLVVMLSAVFVVRRRVLGNAISREILGGMSACAMVMLLHRVIARSHGVSVPHVLLVDVLFVTLAMAMAGIGIYRGVLKLVPLGLLGAAVIFRWPGLMVQAYVSTVVLVLIGSVLLWRGPTRT